MKTKNSAIKINKRALGLGLGGTLAFALGALTLSPTWYLGDTTPDPDLGSVPTKCVKRQVSANYNTANTWQAKTVCDVNEVAIAGAGRCPSGTYLRGIDIVSGGNQELDRTVYIQCSASGSAALWTGTCCEMKALEEVQ